MHRYTAYNNIAYNNNNYLSVIPCVKRYLCILYHVSSMLHPSSLPNYNAALISTYIFI